MKPSWLRKARYYAVAAAAVATVSIIAACGGGGTYEAPTKTVTTATQPSWWASYDQSADTLESAATVGQWIKNGYKTDTGAPVVILDVETDFTSATANRIIGSTSYTSIESYKTSDTRAEGPIDTTATPSTAAMLSKSSVMVLKGASMDAMIQDLGITKDTVIVFTSKGAPIYNETRLWWTFYYWGFSEKNIKILDGGVAAMATAEPTLVNTSAASVDPTDSTFSVMNLPAMHSEARASTKDVIDLVKAGKAKIIDVRASASVGGTVFNGRIKGAIYSADGLTVGDITTAADNKFIPKTTAQAALTDATSTLTDLKMMLGSVSSTDTIIVHCVTGFSASPIYYYLKEVMKYPNVVLYDGSWSAWSSYAGYERGASYASEALYWNATQFFSYLTGVSTGVDSTIVALGGPLQASTTNSAILAYDTTKLSTATGTTPQTITFAATTNWRDAYGVLLLTVNPTYTGTGNEIEEQDKAYQQSNDAEELTTTTTTTTTPSTGTSGGGTSSGC